MSEINDVSSLNYNEGWNAYRQTMAQTGQPLFSSRPIFWITNYPFLSFHFIALLSRFGGNVLVIGRVVEFFSLIVLTLMVGKTVQLTTNSCFAGLYSALCLFLWISTFTPERRAIDDPGLLGEALSSVAFLFFVYGERYFFLKIFSAATFALALFCKQESVLIPASLAIYLLSKGDWKSILVYAAAGGSTALFLLYLSDRFDGPYFLAELLHKRKYIPDQVTRHVLRLSFHFGFMFLLFTFILMSRRSQYKRLIIIFFTFTMIFGTYLAGGDGVNSNIFYPALVAVAFGYPVIACEFRHEAKSSARIHRSITYVIWLVPALSGILFAPYQLYKDYQNFRLMPIETFDTRNCVQKISEIKGDAICETILLCYYAGKPVGYDPYFVFDQIQTLQIKEASVVSLLNEHHFGVIEVDGQVSTDPKASASRLRFTRSFMQALIDNYHVTYKDSYFTIFEPN